MSLSRGLIGKSRKKTFNMTYRGRPSPGCQTCRRRKKKCDNTQPTCKNCAKSGWKCPGYPDSLDLLFRHENAKVVEKAKAARQEPRGARSERRHLVSSLDQSNKTEDGSRAQEHPKKDVMQIADCQSDPEQTSPEITCPGATLSLDLDELAFGYFFHYYVIRDEEVSDSWRAAECDSCLSASILALGSAGVTSSGPGSCCSPAAQARYLDAIRLINSALRSPSDVKKDSVLLSVNLLGVFEWITGYHKSLEAWHNHIEGAAALLQHRGSEQFETAEGGRLFMRTASTLVLSCVGRRCHIPTHIHQLMEMAEEQVPLPKDKMWRILRLTLRFADLYANFPPGTKLSSAQDVQALIMDALTLDREMATLLGDFDEDWYFETVHINRPAVFAGATHIYSHWTVAQMCICMRWERILIHDMVARALRGCADPKALQISAADMLDIHNATDTVRQLQHDIFASVPQHLGNHFPELNSFEPLWAVSPVRGSRDRMWTSFTIKDSNPWRCRRRQRPSLPLVRMSCGSQLPWAVYIAGSVDSADEGTRTWTIGILRILGQYMNLKQAIQLAKSLEMGEAQQLDENLDAYRYN